MECKLQLSSLTPPVVVVTLFVLAGLGSDAQFLDPEVHVCSRHMFMLYVLTAAPAAASQV